MRPKKPKTVRAQAFIPARLAAGNWSSVLVAGKGQAVTHVVSGIVRCAHGCETDREQDDRAENERREALREQRSRRLNRYLRLACDL